jgi:hypothetical protein
MKDEHAQFSGSIPAGYGRYLGPMLFQPYAEDLCKENGVASEKITPVPTPALDSTGGSADGRVRHRKAAGPERRLSAW